VSTSKPFGRTFKETQSMKATLLLFSIALFGVSCGSHDNPKDETSDDLCGCLGYTITLMSEMNEAFEAGDKELIKAIDQRTIADKKMQDCKKMLESKLKRTKKQLEKSGELQPDDDLTTSMPKVLDKLSPNCEHTADYLKLLDDLINNRM
jgi:hypothetical protein